MCRCARRQGVHRALHVDPHAADRIDGGLRQRDRIAALIRMACGDDLGERSQGDLLLGPTHRAVGRAADPFQAPDASALKDAENGGGPTAAGDQSDVGDVIA